MMPDACLPEKGGSRAGQSHSKADRHQQRKQDHESYSRNNTIHTAFGDTTRTAEDRLVDVQQRQAADWLDVDPRSSQIHECRRHQQVNA